MDQQLSSVQLHVLKIKASLLEWAQPNCCDELSGEESDKLTVSTELYPTKTTYYFLRIAIWPSYCLEPISVSEGPVGQNPKANNPTGQPKPVQSGEMGKDDSVYRSTKLQQWRTSQSPEPKKLGNKINQIQKCKPKKSSTKMADSRNQTQKCRQEQSKPKSRKLTTQKSCREKTKIINLPKAKSKGCQWREGWRTVADN